MSEWVEVYCWNCGEHQEMPFSKCSPYNKNMGSSCCPACGIRSYIFWKDLMELQDRRENRGI